MSTLVAQTISNGTVSTSTANVINGAKAWVTMGTANTILASYNVSSVTLGATTRTVNFTNAMPNANYAAIASTRRNSTADGTGENNVNNGVNFRGLSTYTTAFTTSAVQICTGAVSDENLYDFDYVAVAVFSS